MCYMQCSNSALQGQLYLYFLIYYLRAIQQAIGNKIKKYKMSYLGVLFTSYQYLLAIFLLYY